MIRDYADDHRELTLAELEGYLKPLIHFGRLELKVIEGNKIAVNEIDAYCYKNEDRETIWDRDVTRPFVLSMDDGGKIGFIEHPYNAFTMANKAEIVYLIDLIGVKIVI